MVKAVHRRRLRTAVDLASMSGLEQAGARRAAVTDPEHVLTVVGEVLPGEGGEGSYSTGSGGGLSTLKILEAIE